MVVVLLPWNVQSPTRAINRHCEGAQRAKQSRLGSPPGPSSCWYAGTTCWADCQTQGHRQVHALMQPKCKTRPTSGCHTALTYWHTRSARVLLTCQILDCFATLAMTTEEPAGWALKITTPSGFACHPSRGGEFTQGKGRSFIPLPWRGARRAGWLLF